VELHRVSARRRRGVRYRRSDEPEVVARVSGRGDGEVAARAAAAAAKDSGNALTVNDFARASGATPANGIYDRGEAHPDEDVSLPGTHAVTARVEAAPAERDSPPLERDAPADLVGPPLVAPERVTHAAEVHETPRGAEGAAPTHVELAEEVEQPMMLPGLYRGGRLVVLPPMRGSREILVHQNTMADEEGLSRIQDDDDLRRMRTDRMLVDFPESASLRVNPELAGDRRCARPWTVRFAANIARAYYERFGQPLQVNSAVRTVAYQVRLRRVNGNAAGTEGDVASPHLTGEALDFGKHGMSSAEIAWMRLYLRPLMRDGKLDVEEEFQQACFHISVYRSYAPDMPGIRRRYARSEVAQVREPRAMDSRENEDR
jgi:hypothetical protein